jgi:glycerol transport system ATP-binding protein
MARIHLDNISHAYGPNPTSDSDYALKNLDQVWEDGGAYALLGPSGCGKSTLLNIISGLLTPSKGHVRFGDADVTGMDTRERNIAQVFQFPVIYDTMTVRENLSFPLKNGGMPKAEIAERVAEVAGLLDLEDVLDTKATGLTADAKQIISLGRGLVRRDVNAILFDEPLTVIDPHMKWRLRSKLKEIHKQLALTMIYVTHDQTEALTFADKVVVMHDGEVVQVGTPQQLFERPEHTFVGYFIGSPGMNILPATLKGSIADVDGSLLALKGNYNTVMDGRVEIGIRPEFLSFSAGDAGIDVQINQVTDLGRKKIASVMLGNHMLHVLVPEHMDIPSDNAKLVFDPEYTFVYHDDRLVEGASS